MIPAFKNVSLVYLILTMTSLEAQTLTIGRGDGQYPPYEWSHQGALKGIHIDLVRKVASNLGHTVEFNNLPWSRALIELKEGRIEALTFMGKNAERASYTHFIAGNIISESRLTLFRRIDKQALSWNGDLKNLSGYVIGVHKDYFYSQEFESAANFKKQEVKSYQQMLRLAYLERIDFGLVNEYELKYAYRDDSMLSEIEFIQPPLSVLDSYLGFSKALNTDKLAKEFADEITKLKKSGFYRELLRKYELLDE